MSKDVVYTLLLMREVSIRSISLGWHDLHLDVSHLTTVLTNLAFTGQSQSTPAIIRRQSRKEEEVVQGKSKRQGTTRRHP